MKVHFHKLGNTATAGFNLVELIVVIAVLGTSASLVIPMISPMLRRLPPSPPPA